MPRTIPNMKPAEFKMQMEYLKNKYLYPGNKIYMLDVIETIMNEHGYGDGIEIFCDTEAGDPDWLKGG